MSTTIQPEVSTKNKYWLERHRYYELKHFCLQYPYWKKAYKSLDGMQKHPVEQVAVSNPSAVSDPTAMCATAKLYYRDRMDIVEKTASKTDPVLGAYLLRGVTEELSYDQLRTDGPVPCSRDVYYDLYRKFFWLLDKARD